MLLYIHIDHKNNKLLCAVILHDALDSPSVLIYIHIDHMDNKLLHDLILYVALEYSYMLP